MDPDSDSEPGGSMANRGPAVFAVTTATLVLASVFVFARMISRYFIVKRVTWDDRIILLAWLISFFLSFTICFGVSKGLGKHDVDIPPEQIPTLRHCEYVFSILYNPALMATKTSILIFYLRLTQNLQMVLRFASWLTLIIVNIAGVVLTFMNIFQCRPVQAAWNADYNGPTKCIPLLTEFICAAPVNIVTDLAILALPIPVLTGMRLPSRQKTILVITFTLGIFVAVVDVIRIYYLQQAIAEAPTGTVTNPSSRFGGQADFAYNASLALMWSAIEVNVGITCACIPTLKPLVLLLLPSMLYKPNAHGTRHTPHTSSEKSRRASENPTPGSNNSNINNNNLPGVATPEPVVRGALGGRHYDCLGPDAPMSAMEFLTTPDMASLGGPANASANRSRTTNTVSTDHSYENGIYFGFVNMTKPKSMLRANKKESWKYCTIVAILFLLWGISYGLLNTLNNAIATVNNMSTAQTIGLTSAYFGGGYFFGPILVGEWILRRDEHSRFKRHRDDENIGGYKATFITGLCIYGTGTIIFWPSAVTNSFGGFMISSFVVGFGLSVLEVAANSFMVLCGPPQYGEARLMLAQAVQAVGSVLSGLLAQKVFFTSLNGVQSSSQSNSTTLLNVQWTYLGITLLCVVLGLFFYYMPLPEVSDSELEESTRRLPVDPCKKSIGGLQLRTVSLILAVVAQYFYVGGQESNSTFFNSLIISILPGQPRSGRIAAGGTAIGINAADPDQPPGLNLSLADYLTVGHTVFAISRFAATYLIYLSVKNPRLPQPRTILCFSIILCFISALLCVVLRPSNTNLLFIPACLFFFAEGPIWPLIFAIGMRGQGRRTKRAAAFITMGGSGPLFFPFIMYGIIVRGGSVQHAFILIVAMQVAMMALPMFLTFVKDARLMVDPRPSRRALMNRGERPLDVVLADGDAELGGTDSVTITTDFFRETGPAEKVEKPQRGFIGMVSKGLSAKLQGSRRKSSPTLEVEHSEGSVDD
ncbi:uncharacterized protein TrAFT101_007282 [Trichoderma asperellum]|uniref:Rhodopsin domain-containing protein n=1 Tax=Trichoderma asperellum (strain ATCC 204424 / CBS 433.97 / NBRC 101777) TaxID=1042311 RepID=A0A2T3YWA9_TRIA4|nr:hypothetical protein M441DRAFT_149769 [Trichoderma asperellum CBS 433.97]PTB36851.1 hypothetical protein M441DRAFT_149769 [Trichoderma asperellum CBS 433.97]UKZ92322.1 hypothetical protein TrAFT101_007282 [Trichoderma asperellum]